MTREEAIEIVNKGKCPYPVSLKEKEKNEAFDMAISALSAEGKYIKKADILNELGDVNMDILTDEVKEIVNGLPTYSFSDSAENKGDLISRQAVLDELEKWDWQELYLPIHFKQILDDVPSVENKEGWIPIEKRLPEKSGRVYVTVDYYRTRFVTTAIYDKTIRKFIQGFCDPVEHVTAWREDIEPYKAESEGTE